MTRWAWALWILGLSACSRTSGRAEAEHDAEPAKAVRAMAFEAASSQCFGPCVPQVTSIDADGEVMHAVNGTTWDGKRPSCVDGAAVRVSETDMKHLRALALDADVTKMQPSYPGIIPDQASLTTVVVIDGRRFTVDHPSELPSMGPEAEKRYAGVARLIELNREIRRLGKTEEWLRGCSLPEPDAGATD